MSTPLPSASGGELWQTFQETFLSRLHSADYSQTFSTRLLDTPTALDVHSLKQQSRKRGGGKTVRGGMLLGTTELRLLEESGMDLRVLGIMEEEEEEEGGRVEGEEEEEEEEEVRKKKKKKR